MILGSGLPEEEGLWARLESLRPLEGQGDHVFLTHYAFFIGDPHEETFDIGRTDQYLSWYFGLDRPVRERLLAIGRRCGLTRVITGHIHCRREVVADGVSFDYAPGIAFAQWGDRGDGGILPSGAGPTSATAGSSESASCRWSVSPRTTAAAPVMASRGLLPDLEAAGPCSRERISRRYGRTRSIFQQNLLQSSIGRRLRRGFSGRSSRFTSSRVDRS
jgi:hypothetical protein